MAKAEVPSEIRRYAKEDVRSMIKYSKDAGYDADLVDLQFTTKESDGKETIDVTAIINYSYKDDNRYQTKYTWQYTIDGDDVWIQGPMSMHRRHFVQALADSSDDKSIESATTIGKHRIVAADEDDELEFGVAEDDGDFSDTLDEMADNIEDMQDDIEDIQEDDVNIEVENNIDGHYIAECERCHGIFISATVQSDQVVEKVTGICPLCEKESDQYLRWVVQAVE